MYSARFELFRCRTIPLCPPCYPLSVVYSWSLELEILEHADEDPETERE